MTGELEPTNEGYALSKIVGLKMCQYYNKQYGFNAISLMPANLYGINDNFNIEKCHVIPAMIRKFIDAKEYNQDSVTCFGDGTPTREFLYSDDLADACLFLMNNYNSSDIINVGNINNIPVYSGIGDFQASLINIKPNELYINMATGSQMAILVDKLENNKNTNYRPFFYNNYLKCITHIPSGRYLNIFNNLFEDIFTYDLTYKDIINSNLLISTNIFDNNGLTINNITFNNFNKKNIIASIFKSYLDQYINYYNIYFKNLNIDKIVLAGGIPKKILFIKDYFEYYINKPIIINSECDDDSIFGLLNLITK
jgi:hypothetical protein